MGSKTVARIKYRCDAALCVPRIAVFDSFFANKYNFTAVVCRFYRRPKPRNAGSDYQTIRKKLLSRSGIYRHKIPPQIRPFQYYRFFVHYLIFSQLTFFRDFKIFRPIMNFFIFVFLSKGTTVSILTLPSFCIIRVLVFSAKSLVFSS